MTVTNRIFTYKLKEDSGFAPNPFGGILTLVTGKPYIRKHKKVGDWIGGFTSNNLNKKMNKEPYDFQRLIYLMEITDKITFEDYWNDKRFESRKPKNIDSHIISDKIGDNIYKPLKKHPHSFDDFEQIENLYHTTEKIKEFDLKGIYVLISKNFYYFGDSPIDIPYEIAPKIPTGQAAHGFNGFKNNNAKKDAFLSWMKSNFKTGIYDRPHKWFKNDETYKLDINYIGEN